MSNSIDSAAPPDFGKVSRDLNIPPSPQLVRVRSHGNTSTTSSGNRPRTDTATSSTTGFAPNGASASDGKYYHAQVKDEHISSHNFAFLSEFRAVFSCGHWDRTIRITSVDTGRLLLSLTQHKDIVTCISIVKDYGQYWLISGSRDCTLIVWDINITNNTMSVVPIRTLFGHDDTINCLAVNPELDLIVSGSDDGTIIMHNLRDGKYIRSIINSDTKTHWNIPSFSVDGGDDAGGGTDSGAGGMWNELTITPRRGGGSLSPMDDDGAGSTLTPSAMSASTNSMIKPSQKYDTWKVNWVGISIEGYIVSYSAEQHRLVTFSLNGDFIATKKVPETLYCFLLSEDGAVLLSGGSCCLVVFRWVSQLKVETVFVA